MSDLLLPVREQPKAYIREARWLGIVITAALALVLAFFDAFYIGEKDEFGQRLLVYGMCSAPFVAGYYVRGLWPRLGCLGGFFVITLLGVIVMLLLYDDPDEGKAIMSFVMLFAVVGWLMVSVIFVFGMLTGGLVGSVARIRSNYVISARDLERDEP